MKGIKIRYFIFFLFIFLTIKTSAAWAEEGQPLPTYNLSVSFDIRNNLLKGIAVITLPEDRKTVIQTGDLKIISANLNGRPFDCKIKENRFEVPGRGTLEIRYEGIFKGGKEESIENVGIVSTGVISDHAISLTWNWYPAIEGLVYYKLTAVIPENFLAISEANEITFMKTASGKEYSFNFPHPLSNGIDLVAGNYREVRDTVNGIDIYTYLFPEETHLADKYIAYSKKYFTMYNEFLGNYPYKRFSVVENILPTGYSMPTFTLLGRDIVRLPFIPETSLGHEITHQWFGNYVYGDIDRGNWLEAITTYLSDHLYEDQKGRGWEYRKKILTDFQSYVTPEKEFPLKDFIGRTDFASKAIGYGKGAMLFHMLKNLVGEEIFYKSLKGLIENNKFKRVSWIDVQKSFEMESGKDLGWFFSQWLDRKGVPVIEVKDPMASVLKGVQTVSFEFLQKEDPYNLNLPVKIVTAQGEIKKELQIEKEKQYFEISVNENPVNLIFDENYDIMRRLTKDEFPPVISRLIGDEKRLIVYPEKEKEKYNSLITIFKEVGFEFREEKDIKDKDIKTSSLLVLGFESPILKRLFGDIKRPNLGFTLIVRNNPLNASKVVAYAHGDSKEEVSLDARKIFHYGNYSIIRFENGKNVTKETAKTDRGMIFGLYEPVEGVEPKETLRLNRIIDNICERPVIFIGERHTNYEDHKVELSVIMELHKKGRKFAIGMEMFQRLFQKVINDYISGVINEKEFLKKTEYFKRWGYDYNLYREIIEFARAEGIPVIALNLRSEIIKKVEAGGLDGLSDEEKKEIPQDMDMSDDSYKERLHEIFESHPDKGQFDNFYQSQILWDETMAHSVAEFLQEHPDYQMIVLAGREHVMYGSGIPNRVFRLTRKEYATLINGAFDGDIGNYVLFPGPMKAPVSAKLGVILQEREGKVIIEDFSPESAALKAGFKKGDAILSIDDWKIETINDVKIALVDKNPGQTARMKIVRKKFLLGEKEFEFHVSL